MNLLEALEILRQTDSKNENLLKVFLACSFTPLHLQTFLAAHLRQRSSKQRVEVRTGVFGDLAGNIERLPEAGFNVLAVVIEWQDLDSRLGIRNLGGWRITDLPDIVRSAELALTRLEKAMRRASLSIPTYVCMPSLPFPPLFPTATQQASACELRLRQLVASLAVSISDESSMRVLSIQHLDESSSTQSRFNVQSELMADLLWPQARA